MWFLQVDLRDREKKEKGGEQIAHARKTLQGWEIEVLWKWLNDATNSTTKKQKEITDDWHFILFFFFPEGNFKPIAAGKQHDACSSVREGPEGE